MTDILATVFADEQFWKRNLQLWARGEGEVWRGDLPIPEDVAEKILDLMAGASADERRLISGKIPGLSRAIEARFFDAPRTEEDFETALRSGTLRAFDLSVNQAEARAFSGAVDRMSADPDGLRKLVANAGKGGYLSEVFKWLEKEQVEIILADKQSLSSVTRDILDRRVSYEGSWLIPQGILEAIISQPEHLQTIVRKIAAGDEGMSVLFAPFADQFKNELLADPVANDFAQADRSKGGIDFDARWLELQIKKDFRGFLLPIASQPAVLRELRGLIPVIEAVRPFNQALSGAVMTLE